MPRSCRSYMGKSRIPVIVDFHTEGLLPREFPYELRAGFRKANGESVNVDIDSPKYAFEMPRDEPLASGVGRCLQMTARGFQTNWTVINVDEKAPFVSVREAINFHNKALNYVFRIGGQMYVYRRSGYILSKIEELGLADR